MAKLETVEPLALKLTEVPPPVDGPSFLVFTDIHFKDKNAQDSKVFIEEVLNYAREYPDLTAILCLGDTLDGHRSLDMPSLNRATRFFRELAKIAPLFVLIGNHDRCNNRVFLTDESPFLGLKGEKNITIVDEPCEVSFFGLNFLFVPYVQPGRFAEAIQSYDLALVAAIFAHQEFKGAASLTSEKSKVGDAWSPTGPLIISGHYHEQHVLKNKVVYMGAAFQHTKGENQHKGISVFQFEADVCRWWFIEGLVEPDLVFILKETELKKFKMPERGRVRLEIEISSGSDPTKNPNLKRVPELEALGVRISYKFINKQKIEPTKVELSRHSFNKLLKNALSNNESLQERLQEIM